MKLRKKEIKENEMTITVDYNQFLEWFPYFQTLGVTETQVQNAYEGVGAFISTKEGSICLVNKLHIRGVYLATAHKLYLAFNPSSANGMTNSATQGSESAGFQQKPVVGWNDYYLGLTPYGIELLSILKTVQPCMPTKKTRTYPYYNTFSNINNI